MSVTVHSTRTPRPDTTRRVQHVTLWGLAVNLALSGAKFAAGVVGGSQALVADAVHSLSDSATDLAILIGAPYWAAPADADHPYGHRRIETIITFLIGAVLGAVGLALAYYAVATAHQPHLRPPGWIAFGTACVSMVSKELLYRWTVKKGKRLRSSALMANAWHHRSDGLSSLPVAIATLGARLRPDWAFIDHVAAVLVSVFILQAAWKILWPALMQLADTGAPRQEREKLRTAVAGTPGVKAVHALRTRRIGPGLQVDLHLLVDPDLTVRQGHEVARSVEDRLRSADLSVIDVLVHVEPHEPAPKSPGPSGDPADGA